MRVGLQSSGQTLMRGGLEKSACKFYAGRGRKISPQILCWAGQLGSLFVGQVRGEPMWGELAGIATPSSRVYL